MIPPRRLSGKYSHYKPKKQKDRELLSEFRYISTHNKINFIDTKDKNLEMSSRLAFGLFALLNSTIYDRFLSIISKSKQINAKEMRALPLPPADLSRTSA